MNNLENLCKRIRKQIIALADFCGGDAHWGGALSSVEMLATLYGDYLNAADTSLDYYTKDKFILSKGQSAIGLYSTLAEVGVMEKSYLENFQQNGSILGELAIMDEEHGIECSGGSLGLGLPMGLGMALAAKRKGYTYKVVVMAGDGECNEGSIWEAIMLAGQLKLDNLTFIIDLNGHQSDGATADIIDNSNIDVRVRTFGWATTKINGHDLKQCQEALSMTTDGKPKLIAMETVKGKGISFMENDNDWHHKILNGQLLEQARKEVEF